MKWRKDLLGQMRAELRNKWTSSGTHGGIKHLHSLFTVSLVIPRYEKG